MTTGTHIIPNSEYLSKKKTLKKENFIGKLERKILRAD